MSDEERPPRSPEGTGGETGANPPKEPQAGGGGSRGGGNGPEGPPPPPTPEGPENPEEGPEETRADESRARRSPPRDEEGSFKIIAAEINEKIKQNLLNPDDQKLSPEEQINLGRFIRGDASYQDVREALNKIGLSPELGEEFESIAKSLFEFSPRDIDRYVGSISNPFLRDMLLEAKDSFDIHRILADYFDKTTDSDTGEETYKFTQDQGKRKQFRKVVDKYFYDLFQKIDENPAKLFQDVFDPYQDSFYLNGLKGLISEINSSPELKKLINNEKNYKEFTEYMRQGINGRLQSLLNFGEVFHNLPIYAADPSNFERWPSFFAQLFPSEIAGFLDDPVMKIAKSTSEQYIRMRLALNGNKIPPDIFAGEYGEKEVAWVLKDQEALIELVRKRVKILPNSEKIQEWEILRAISYARGLGLITLRDFVVMGTADSASDFKSIPDQVMFVRQRHKWGQGRGGTSPLHLPELLTMDIIHNPEKRSVLKRIFKKRPWVPSKIRKYVDDKIRLFGSKIDLALLDRKGTWQELMNIFDIGSLEDRAGWRIDHLITADPEIKGKLSGNDPEYPEYTEHLDYSKKSTWTDHQWDKFFDIITEELGVGGLSFFYGGRVDAEMEKELKIRLVEELKEIKADDWEEGVVHDYHLGSKAFEKIFEVDGKKLTFLDRRQQKESEIKGKIFERLYRRAPGNFLMNLTQLVPEILKISKSDDNWVWEDGGGSISGKSGDPKNTKQRRAQRTTVIEAMKERWGLDNYKFLNKIANVVFKKLDEQGISHKEFFEELGTAFERVKLAGRLDMKSIDIKNLTIRAILFDGDDAFVNYFKDQKDFFATVGKVWTTKNGDINPDTSDLNYFKVFKYMGKAGETTLRRHLGDVKGWNEVTSLLANLDTDLYEAAQTKSLKKIDELHHKIQALEKVVGIDPIKKANYIVGSIVTSYLWEHDIARLPGGVLVNFPIRLALGRKLSLSKMRGGRLALSWDDQDVRNYWRSLAFDKNYIDQTGAYSYEAAQLAFDAKTDTFIASNVLPSIASVLALYLIFISIKKGLEEEVQGKKR